MRLCDALTTCLILLSAARASSLLRNREQLEPSQRRRSAEGPPAAPTRLSVTPKGPRQQNTMEDHLPNDRDVVEFMQGVMGRARRSSSSSAPLSTSSLFSYISTERARTRHRRGWKMGAKQRSDKVIARGGDIEKSGRKSRRRGGRVQDCALRQIHLNVSDLGLGHRSSEELIFRYCSGPCKKSQTNYDKILFSLVHRRKLSSKDSPLQACCRPVAFDDDLSFLDDSLIYHTLRKHSARKCACV